MIHYTHCPICNSQDIHADLTVKDYSVSQEEFLLFLCKNCTLKFTQDIPDRDQIGKYYQFEDYISHTDTQKGFINTLYHQVRVFTLVSKRKLLIKETRKTKGSVLDVGCGTGAFLHEMKKGGWNVTGLEPDETARENAKKLYQIDALENEALMELPENFYDAITLWHVLEHVHDLQAYMARFKKILKPEGRLIIAVPNYTAYDARHYQAGWAAYDVPRHLYHFSPQSMKELMTRQGFSIRKIKPMLFDSFYVSMLSEKNTTSKTNIVKAFGVGFISNLYALWGKNKCSSQIYIAEPM